jgi:hypothetical protein
VLVARAALIVYSIDTVCVCDWSGSGFIGIDYQGGVHNNQSSASGAVSVYWCVCVCVWRVCVSVGGGSAEG